MPPRAPTKADIEFMQGMIHHHSQAVEMTALMPTHTKNKKLLALGQRISISQTDEMKFMKQWLQERATARHGSFMDMDMDMAAMPLMPGMLTKQQLEALAKAKGPEFDRLFLTGMIQHHGGALTMVRRICSRCLAGRGPGPLATSTS